MTQRTLALAGYLLRSLLFSLAGILYILLALAMWWVLFYPYQTTPNMDYYILVIAMLGAVLSFLVTFTMAARANQAIHYPMLVRLPSRVEYLATVLASSFVYATALQILIAVLAIYHGPVFTPGRVIQMIIVWLPVNGLMATLALQASDLVTNGWSRTYVYGGLVISVIGQKVSQPIISRMCSAVFWPFQAIVSAVRANSFSLLQVLALVAILLYGVMLWMLAVSWFTAKDLHLVEQ